MTGTPAFGALVTNLLADPGGARRRGYFVGTVRHTAGRGSLPTGTYWRLTDGAGNFWEIHPPRGELALHPDRRAPVVEVDEATGLAPLTGRIEENSRG